LSYLVTSPEPFSMAGKKDNRSEKYEQQ
jgi:hypothetical protein